MPSCRPWQRAEAPFGGKGGALSPRAVYRVGVLEGGLHGPRGQAPDPHGRPPAVEEMEARPLEDLLTPEPGGVLEAVRKAEEAQTAER